MTIVKQLEQKLKARDEMIYLQQKLLTTYIEKVNNQRLQIKAYERKLLGKYEKSLISSFVGFLKNIVQMFRN